MEDVVKRLMNAVCCDMPSTSKYSASTLSEDPDFVVERLHYEMITKAAKLIRKVDHIKYFGVLCMYLFLHLFPSVYFCNLRV